ncbi:hypothetical protein F5J12DRAFT_785131 [Pisolithus orientalis]|uniref:uncharacterized protein n=1 Tax=Pisolithus orientalis TaxID=936130 RepID=UPI0022254CAF|nr:uncharacterized protein F5J12DRAFT_785131 [Pisolithus orientalis]KAI5997667.1 hypothetical protein F5J12DRAFT_785131 [Pisolithus orientalis]
MPPKSNSEPKVVACLLNAWDSCEDTIAMQEQVEGVPNIQLRQLYAEIQRYCASGKHWDNDNSAAIVGIDAGQVWDEYMKTHKSLCPYRNWGWSLFDMISEIMLSGVVSSHHAFDASAPSMSTPTPSATSPASATPTMSTTLTTGEFNAPSMSAATNSASTAITAGEDEGP